VPALLDSHVHFWDPGQLLYPWLEEHRELRRPHLPKHWLGALPESRRPGAHALFVQADCRPEDALAEAAWVLALADTGAPVAGLVAWAPLSRGAGARPHLEALRELPGAGRIRGVRELLQDRPSGTALEPAFLEGIALLAEPGWRFDLCLRQPQLAEAGELVRRSPEVLFVLDHLGKPSIEDRAFDAWRRDLDALAALPNIAAKVSGLLTEAPPEKRRLEDLRPWLDHLRQAFGPDRLLFGGDWPVVDLAGGLAAWTALVEAWSRDWPEEERTALWCGNARRIYGLDGAGGTERTPC